MTINNGSMLTQQLRVGFIITTIPGAEIVTATVVTIPPSNPPRYGLATVTAHAAVLLKGVTSHVHYR